MMQNLFVLSGFILFFVSLQLSPEPSCALERHISAHLALNETISIVTPRSKDAEWFKNLDPVYLGPLKKIIESKKDLSWVAIQKLLGGNFEDYVARFHPEWKEDRMREAYTKRLLALLEVLAIDDLNYDAWPKWFEISGTSLNLIDRPLLTSQGKYPLEEKTDASGKPLFIVAYEIPRTAAEITQRSKKKAIDQMYELLAIVDTLSKEYSYPYVAIGGTCLGAIRHQGLIPWEDEINIGMSQETAEAFLKDPKVISTLKKHKIQCVDWFGGYRLFFKDRVYKYIFFAIQQYFPALNILTLEKNEKNEWGPSRTGAKRVWKSKEVFSQEDFDKSTKRSFGPLMISVLDHPEEYLNRRYGAAWPSLAISRWNQPKGSEYTGSFYLLKDRSHAPYTGDSPYIISKKTELSQ